MLKRIRFFLLFVIIAGCIDPYEFIVHDPSPSLVVEAFLSDKSFHETLTYPSDGRYFTVRLTETGDVTNSRPIPVNGAVVRLLTSEGEALSYSEDAGGIYTLLDNDFKARRGIQYKLHIATPDEHIYESTWEQLPEPVVPRMGEVGFSETENRVYEMEASEWVVRTRKVALANVNVPPNNTREPIYYRWTFSPLWIYVAPLVSQNDPAYRCWATDPYYLPSYTLQADRAGGYKQDLFSIPTIRNARIFEKFSVLITQHAMTEGYYTFWKELKDQHEHSALVDVPPFNLKTNFSSSTGAKQVSGYFGVTSEQARRWYFDRTELSYYVENTLRADCLVVYGPDPPAPECFDCTQYSFGKATTNRPPWWQQ